MKIEKNYFEENAAKLAPLTLNGQKIYRECQVGAAWATLAHFTASSEPALISMPTGSGKTALMMMLSFLLKPKRVIIVTPSVVLRDQTANKFSDLLDLKDVKAFPKKVSGPLVHNHQGQLTSTKAWEDFLKYDVIVTTPHTTSPGYEEIVGPSSGLFDSETLLFFDEAHHSRARTWQVLMETFTACHVILLTATPFRNDNRRLLAKLVYHYPMKKALDSGIYAPITYHNVDTDDIKKKDQLLCDEALRVYKVQKKKHSKARLLIRAEGVLKSGELLKLYQKAGLQVEEVNYKKTLQENKNALDGVRAGRLDGVVCVDQIGEGLDIPNLKIAVLHKPRQSFPATIQFVGRICREASLDIGEPHLIACADDVSGRLQKLYTHDNSWRDFVPKLVERIVGKATKRQVFHNVDVETELDLQIEDIKPFFSVRVYNSSTSDKPMFEATLDLSEEVVPVFLHEIPDKNMLVLVTAIEKSFPWAEDADLVTPYFDLHVFYWHEISKHLFEYTTSDKIAGMIRNSLWGDTTKLIKAAAVAKALRLASPSQYLMFGLSNLTPGSRSVPSYKTYMGTEVEGAVRPTDSRSFTPGHALAKYSTGETRGIGSNQGRVWSIKRGSLDEFKDWCDSVAVCLNKGGDSHLPNVEFLPAPESISKFPVEPLAVYSRWDPSLLVSLKEGDSFDEAGSISFDKINLSHDKTSIEGLMSINGNHNTEETSFIFSLKTPRWQFTRTDLPRLRIDNGEEFHWVSVQNFLDAYPPIIVLKDGSSFIGGSRFTPKLRLTSIPEECLDTTYDWRGCDVHLEFEHIDPTDPRKNKLPKPGNLTIQDHLEKWLKASPDKLVIKDHAPGEIADFIEILPKASLIRFYHCKACSPKKSAGARLGELKVLEQVLRNLNHIGNNDLFSELHSRVVGIKRPATRMVKGTPLALDKAGKAFHANEWEFEVVIVNPGINCKKSARSTNINTLLIACYEWLGSANAKLRIIGK